jgi:hypothetical protein
MKGLEPFQVDGAGNPLQGHKIRLIPRGEGGDRPANALLSLLVFMNVLDMNDDSIRPTQGGQTDFSDGTGARGKDTEKVGMILRKPSGQTLGHRGGQRGGKRTGYDRKSRKDIGGRRRQEDGVSPLLAGVFPSQGPEIGFRETGESTAGQ